MTGGYRAGMVSLLIGLLAWVPAGAQTSDSVEDHTEPVVLRTITDSVVTGLKNDQVYAYANDPDYWRRKESTEQSQSSSPSQQGSGNRASEYFILFVLGGILVYAIVRIIVSNRLQLFYRAPRRLMEVKSAEEQPEDNLEGQLMHFMQIKDYRQAVRYLYLKTLRVLTDKGMIRYHQESTNQEYWQQLKATPQGAPFRDLVTIYEKVWYGEFPLGDALFGRLHQYFEDFYKSVRA
jgi:hypothetical protein